MAHQFTPAAHRALAEATRWMSRDDCDTLHAPELLLGLLSETECRAATMLIARGIDQPCALASWPLLRRRDDNPPMPARPFSSEVTASLQAAEIRLIGYPQPLEMATEHILLGLVAAPGAAADWLKGHGFNADQLAAEIHRLYGHTPGPLEFDPSPPPCGAPAQIDTKQPNTKKSDTDAGSSTEAASSASTPLPRVAAGDGIETGVYRIFDAAANRGREALRVVEDYLRFALDDAHLTNVCKKLRHRLTAILANVPVDLRFASRETFSDVGTRISTADEFSRADIADVLAANFKRLEESLRSLEEYGKIIYAPMAAEVEQLRYQVYSLERVTAITGLSLERLQHVQLYVLLDGGDSTAEFAGLAAELISAGVHAIQLRDKKLSDRDLLHRARELRAATRDTSTLMIVNDRPDLAALSGADGVHLGQDELNVKDARAIIGPRALIGVSTHSLDQAKRAVLDGANYIGVGPTFPSGTKTFDHFPGTPLLTNVAAEIRLPTFAIGGINLNNLSDVQKCGIHRIAISGSVTNSPDHADAVRRFLERLGTAK